MPKKKAKQSKPQQIEFDENGAGTIQIPAGVDLSKAYVSFPTTMTINGQEVAFDPFTAITKMTLTTNGISKSMTGDELREIAEVSIEQ